MSEKYIRCECCEELLLVESDNFYTDPYYEIYDDIICGFS